MLFLKHYLWLFAIGLHTILLAQADQTETPQLEMGGALRFNYNLSTWKPGQVTRGGDFGFDVFRVNTRAQYKGVKLNADYRLYSQAFGGGMLKQGWVGYDFSAEDNLQIGLTQVPFGITQYNSNSWFFGLNYYLGMEDDHDMGVKFSHHGSQWEYALAFFKNAEELRFGSLSDVSDNRYSYDVASIDLDGDGKLDLRNKEVNQFNAKVNYRIDGAVYSQKIGLSAQVGGLYNLDTQRMGHHYALAVHYELNVGGFGIKAQWTDYAYHAQNKADEPTNIMAMTAYGAPYLVASQGAIYTLGVAYKVEVDWGPISSMLWYNDVGYLDKADAHFSPTLMNVTGVCLTAGQVYTYIDWGMGKNQPWIGSEWTKALAQGVDNAPWEARFNINIGYYF